MQKIKNAVVIFLMIYMIFANNIICYAVEEDQQRYYLLYMNDSDNGVSVEIGFYQIITDHAYEKTNLDNLILFPIETGVYHPFQMEQLGEEELEREIREYLLYAGYARIDDEDIAEDYELAAQEHAKLNSLGGWNETSNEQESVVIQKESNNAQEKNMLTGEDAGFLSRHLHKIGTFIKQMSIKAKVIAVIVIFVIIFFARKKRRKQYELFD